MTDKDLKKFGENFRRLRQKYLPDESANRAAQIALLSYTQLKRIEEGKTDPQFFTLVRVAKAWKIPLSEFFEPFYSKK